jgi:hypothetical protein
MTVDIIFWNFKVPKISYSRSKIIRKSIILGEPLNISFYSSAPYKSGEGECNYSGLLASNVDAEWDR